MSRTHWSSVIEALLFVSDAPLSAERLAQILGTDGLDKAGVRKAVADLALALEEQGRALQVVEVAGGYRLVTRKEFGQWVRRLQRPRKVRLSQAALEVLAIVAYKQPVTTPEIEAIRGVNSSGVLKTLLERGLVKVAGRAEAAGSPLLYATTREFLEYFGLRSLRDLPTLKEFQEIVEEHGAALDADDSGGVEAAAGQGPEHAGEGLGGDPQESD